LCHLSPFSDKEAVAVETLQLAEVPVPGEDTELDPLDVCLSFYLSQYDSLTLRISASLVLARHANHR